METFVNPLVCGRVKTETFRKTLTLISSVLVWTIGKNGSKSMGRTNVDKRKQYENAGHVDKSILLCFRRNEIAEDF